MRFVFPLALAILLLGLARLLTTFRSGGDVLSVPRSGPGVPAAEGPAGGSRSLQAPERPATGRTVLSSAAPGALDGAGELEPTEIRGRVVDRSGRPVEGARVELVLRPQLRRFSLTLASRADTSERPPNVTRTDREGRFTLPLQRSGLTSVVAWDPELGTAERTSVRADVPRHLGLLRLEERGVIAGRIVYPDGRPARFLEYELVSHVIDPPDGHGFSLVEFGHRAKHGGVQRVRGRTDAEGRFRSVGLTPGEYTLGYGVSHTSHSHWLGYLYPISTSDVAVRAELDQARLLVRVEDPDGRPCTGSLVRKEYLIPDVDAAWARTSRFVDFDDEPWGTDTPVISPDTGLADLWAAPGYTYLVSAELGEQESEPLRVDFPPNLYELEVALELPVR